MWTKKNKRQKINQLISELALFDDVIKIIEEKLPSDKTNDIIEYHKYVKSKLPEIFEEMKMYTNDDQDDQYGVCFRKLNGDCVSIGTLNRDINELVEGTEIEEIKTVIEKAMRTFHLMLIKYY